MGSPVLFGEVCQVAEVVVRLEGTVSKWCRVAGGRESLPEVTASGSSKWQRGWVVSGRWQWRGDDRSRVREFKQDLSRLSTWRQCLLPLRQATALVAAGTGDSTGQGLLQ